MNELNEIGWNLADEDIARGACEAREWSDDEIFEAAGDYDRPVAPADLPAVRAAYRAAFAEMALAEGVAS
jgi:hypothetical protein